MYVFHEKYASKSLVLILLAMLISGLLLVPLFHIGQAGISRSFALLSALSLFLLFATGLSSFFILVKLAASAPRGIIKVISALSLFFLLAIFALCFLPVTERDALVHHLAVPQWWLEHGRIFEIPWHEWSFYPMLMQLSFLLPVQLGMASLCALTQLASLCMLTAILSLFLFTQERKQAAVLVIPLALNTPVFLRLASIPLVDLSLALHASSALILLLLCTRKQSWPLLACAGISLGLALSTKYNAFLFFPFFLACAAYLFWSSAYTFKHSALGITLLALLSLCIASPWLLKNYAWTGNPVHPLAKKYFVTEQHEPAGAKKIKTQQIQKPDIFEKREALYGEGVLATLSIPFRIFVQGQDGSPQFFDGKLNMLFLAAFLLFFLPKKEHWALPVLMLTIAYLLCALISASPRVRYLAPIFGPLVLLGALAWDRLAERGARWKIFQQAAFALQFIIAAGYLFTLTEKKELIPYLSGHTSHTNYLEQHLPEQKLIHFVNTNLPPHASLYLLYTGDRYYYFERSVRSAGYDSGKELRQWLGEGQSLHMRFFELGVTHIIFHQERLQTVLQGMTNQEERKLWNDFQTQHLRFLHHEGQYALWEILP